MTRANRDTGVERPSEGRWVPLRAYLGALLALFAITTLVSVVFVGRLEDRNTVEAARTDARFGASLAASDINTALTLLQSTVAQIATTPAFAPAFDRSDCTVNFVIPPFAVARLDFVRLDGSVLCSSSAAAKGSSHAGATWLQSPTVAVPLTAPVDDPVTKRPSVMSAVPVPGRGLVVGIAELTTLGPALASHFAGPQALEYLVISPDGHTILARSIDPERWAGIPLDVTPFGQAAGLADRPDVAGTPRVYSSATVTAGNWQVFAGADRDAALAPARDLFRQHASIMVAGMIVLLLGTLLLYRLILMPLRRLSEAMGTGTSGVIRGPVTPSGPAEIAGLALRFNALIAAVRAEITERGHAEQVAQQSERNYRLLFAGNPRPLFVYDLDSLAFLEVNDAAIARYGYTRDEFRSLSVADILTSNDTPALRGVKSNPDLHRSGPWKHRLKDGSLIDVELTSIRLAYDRHDARLVVVEDFTEQRKLELQLQQSQRLETVGQLAGGIAHDFNNLLAVILNYADFVAEELPEGDLRNDVEEIRHAATRAADLTRQLLIFARREMANPQVLDLNAVITGVEKLIRRTLGEDIELSVSLADGLPSVRADPGQIEQVFLNLAVNARDAMSAGGRLLVETSAVELDDDYLAMHPGVERGQYVRLSVSDTGVGMSQDVAARAFEPFFTTKAPGHGTGLGLATVYGIVTQAGGNIGIYSEPGLGTRVSIHLPAVGEPASVREEPRAATAIQTGEGRTLLVVEDENAVLLAAVRILSAHGYKVLARSDPTHAVDVLGDLTTHVDLLVTDVVMPRLPGVELARQAQALRPGLPVLFMSGYSQDLVTHRGTLPAGSMVLQKPFTRRDLLEAVASLLSPGAPDA